MPEIGETRRFRSRDTWRRWLEKNHAKRRELWLLFVKKHVERARVTYDEAVEEALCFGWIDGIVKRVDEDEYVIRFSPRRATSVWSLPNVKRVNRMIRAGKMTEAGLALVRIAKQNGQWRRAKERAAEDWDTPPADLARALARNAEARKNFGAFAPSHRRHTIAWILAAKKPETRVRRIEQTVARAAANQRPGMP